MVDINKIIADVRSERAHEAAQSKKSGPVIPYNEVVAQKDLRYIEKFLNVISENNKISISYADVTTASINIETKAIILPNYVLDDEDLFILMGSHEVSHALHTPFEFYLSHNNKSKNGRTMVGDLELNQTLHMCINIVEDIRIERLIRNKFPGFVSVYKRAYKTLISRYDGFKVTEETWPKLELHNRLNIAAKAGSELEFKLTDKEIAILKYLKTTETFDDVLKRSVYLYNLIMKDALENKKDMSDVSNNENESDDDIEDSLEDLADLLKDLFDTEETDEMPEDESDGLESSAESDEEGAEVEPDEDASNSDSDSEAEADQTEKSEPKPGASNDEKGENNFDKDLLDKINSAINNFEDKHDIKDNAVEEDILDTIEERAIENLKRSSPVVFNTKTTKSFKGIMRKPRSLLASIN